MQKLLRFFIFAIFSTNCSVALKFTLIRVKSVALKRIFYYLCIVKYEAFRSHMAAFVHCCFGNGATKKGLYHDSFPGCLHCNH